MHSVINRPQQTVFFALPALAVLLTFSGCEGKQAAASAPPPPPGVEVVAVTQKDIPIYSDWVATLDGYVNANIQPQVSGYLLKQNYREGSFVHKGDVLFEIDQRPFQAILAQANGQLAQAKGQLAQAQSQLALAKINVGRDTPLAQAHAIAQSLLDNDTQAQAQAEALIATNQASIQAAEAAIQTAQLNVDFTQVHALVDGIAGIATTQIGNLVGPATVLTTVSKVDPIKVYFPISEQEYLRVAEKIKPGSNGNLLRQTNPVPLQLTLANGQIYPHKGRIIFTDRQVDQQTGTIRVVGEFANPGNILRPGQFGSIRALTALNESALVVPQRAVAELQGHYQVAVVGTENKVSMKPITVGDRVGDNWIVKGDLKAGDQVITQGISKVRDGATVTPTAEKPAPAQPASAQPASAQ